MKKGFIAVSIVLMVMSIFGMIQSSMFERTMKLGIGVGFLPFWMSAIIGFLAITLLIKALRGKMPYEDKPVFPKEGISWVVALAIVLIIYLILIDVIGYLTSTFLFFSITIFLLQRHKIINILLSAALFTFLLYAVFRLWLKSPLPTGFLGI